MKIEVDLASKQVYIDAGISVPDDAELGILTGENITQSTFDQLVENTIPSQYASDGKTTRFPTQKAIWHDGYGGYLVYFYRQ